MVRKGKFVAMCVCCGVSALIAAFKNLHTHPAPNMGRMPEQKTCGKAGPFPPLPPVQRSILCLLAACARWPALKPAPTCTHTPHPENVQAASYLGYAIVGIRDLPLGIRKASHRGYRNCPVVIMRSHEKLQKIHRLRQGCNTAHPYMSKWWNKSTNLASRL